MATQSRNVLSADNWLSTGPDAIVQKRLFDDVVRCTSTAGEQVMMVSAAPFWLKSSYERKDERELASLAALAEVNLPIHADSNAAFAIFNAELHLSMFTL